MPESKGDPTGSPFCICIGMGWVSKPPDRGGRALHLHLAALRVAFEAVRSGAGCHPEAPDRRPLGACPYRRRCAECSPLKFIGGSSQTVIGVRNGYSGVGDLRISASQDSKIRALCMIWRPRTGLGPFPGKNFTQCIPKQRFAGFLDTPHANFAKTSSFWMHSGDMLPRRGVFSVRGSFGDASSENLATVGWRGKL